MKLIYKILSLIEKIAAYLQGKGYASRKLEKELASTLSLLESKNNLLCIDIGGNKGCYTEEIIKRFPKARVIIFEPSKKNINILKKKFKKRVTIEGFAISNKNKITTLYSDKSGSGLASLTKRNLDHFKINFKYSESVKTIKFEDYWKKKLNSQKIDIVKIDIEGNELNALESFGNSLNFISLIQFEFGGANIDSRTYFRDFWYFFKKNNFKIYRITPFGTNLINHYAETHEFFVYTNFVAKKI